MKKTCYFLLMLSLILVSCEREKSPEEQFDLSLIPGQYEGYTEVMESYDTIDGWILYNSIRRIPEYRSPPGSGYDYYIIEIQKAKENQYRLIFEPIDTILPTEIIVEITGFREHSKGSDIRADFRVIQNDLFKDTVLQTFYSGMDNYFSFDVLNFYWMSYNLTLKSKTQNNIVLRCEGSRWID